MSESTGIVYNNEIDDFSIPSASDGLLMSVANSIQPSKSPMSSMAPIIVLNENHEVTLAVGATGKKRNSYFTFNDCYFKSIYLMLRWHSHCNIISTVFGQFSSPQSNDGLRPCH